MSTLATVRVLASPINPADLNMIEGKYYFQPKEPFGMEGVGEIVGTGQRVILPRQTKDDWVGWWQEKFSVDADRLVSVPKNVPTEQAAMMSVNPPTAWGMLHDFVDLKPGDWIIQNAANSAVGIWVGAIAKKMAVNIQNISRRNESETIPDRPYKLGLNAVGGDSALKIAKALAPAGTLVTYGAMSKQPLSIPNGLLIFKDIRLRGFLRARWGEGKNLAPIFEKLWGLTEVPVAAEYPLQKLSDALTHASQSQRGGKILLRIG